MVAQKTAGTRMVESLIGSMLSSAIESAQGENPMPKLSEEGEPITVLSMAKQIEKVYADEPKTAMRIALILGAYLARQQGVREKDALVAAACAWAQTADLTPR
ncbi:MAG: hypothetical protein WC565_06850 [Parcubacteria group bacterium]|jgi:hypothetical protein